MKKDNVYCLRMSTAVLNALKREAEKERRSLSSLLDKIIVDYLDRNGVLPDVLLDAEQRRFPRTQVNLPARVTVFNGSERKDYPCVILEISLGGVLLTYSRGSDVQVIANGRLPVFDLSFQIPQGKDELHFRCRVRHMSEDGSGLKVGAMFEEPAEEDLSKLEAYLS